MISINKAANYFLSKNSMTHKKLQKLCYYAQVLYAGMYSSRLIDTEFEAWIHGPVSRELFFKYQGQRGLPKIVFVEEINEKYKKILDVTYEVYGHLTGDGLETLTHSENPWINARKGKDSNESSTEIIAFQDILEFGKAKINEIMK